MLLEGGVVVIRRCWRLVGVEELCRRYVKRSVGERGEVEREYSIESLWELALFCEKRFILIIHQYILK